MLLIGFNYVATSYLKFALDEEIIIKDLGFARFFLRLEICQSFTGKLIDKHKFIVDVLLEFCLSAARLVPTPLPSVCKMDDETGEVLVNPTFYHCLVSKLYILQ